MMVRPHYACEEGPEFPPHENIAEEHDGLNEVARQGHGHDVSRNALPIVLCCHRRTAEEEGPRGTGSASNIVASPRRSDERQCLARALRPRIRLARSKAACASRDRSCASFTSRRRL